MKALIIGDQHLADRPPSARTDTYRDDILNKLEWIIDRANDEKVDFILNEGDVFHIKRPDRNSHYLLQEAARIFGKSNAPVRIVPGNHDLCVSDDTEALTDKGWKLVYELDGSENFATLDPKTGELIFQPPTSINVLNYSGKMYHFYGPAVDILTTPNHRWLGSWRPGQRLRFKTSEELSTSCHGWRLPSVQACGGNTPSTVVIGEALEWPVDKAMKFFGWFVSEGTVDRSRERITISQSSTVNPDHYAEIVDVLKSLGLNPKLRESMIRVNNAVLARFMADNFGYATSKDVRIPRWLIDMHPYLIRTFLHTYFKGDGTIQGTVAARNEADYDISSVVATTANSKLADDLSELGVRLGYKMYKSPLREFPFGDDYVGYALRLSFNKKRVNTVLPKPEVVETDGSVVWCPTLPNQTWLARRNGKMVWTGNSNDRLDSIPSQPLGSLVIHPNISLVMGADEEFPLYGVPYFDPTPENFNFWVDKYHADGGPDKYPLMATHQAIFPRAEEPVYDFIAAEEWANTFKATWVAYGHIHSQMKAGAHYKVGGTWFCNEGSISRGSLHESSLKRKPSVALFDSEAEGDPFTTIMVPFKPAEEVFKLEAVGIMQHQKDVVENFLGSLGDTTLNFLTVEGIMEHAKESDILDREAVRELEDIITTL